MKRLLIIASLIGVTFSGNASSYIWGFNGFDYVDATGAGYDESAGFNAWSGGTAYLYLGTVTASSSAFDLSGATYITTATFNGTDYVYGNTDISALSSSDLVTKTDAQTFSLILVDSDKALSSYEGNYVLYTGTSTEQTIIALEPVKYADFTYGGAVTQSSWQTMTNVPEPTSAMLLLLGFAGLALRRKRA